MANDVEERIGGVVDGGREGVFGRETVVDRDKDGIAGVEDVASKSGIVGTVADCEATAVEVDDCGVSLAVLSSFFVALWCVELEGKSALVFGE